MIDDVPFLGNLYKSDGERTVVNVGMPKNTDRAAKKNTFQIQIKKEDSFKTK